jgi:MFS family permease
MAAASTFRPRRPPRRQYLGTVRDLYGAGATVVGARIPAGQTAAPPSNQSPVGKGGARVALTGSQSPSTRRLATLLAVAIFINYVDRGNLATAAPVIVQQLHLSATQIGILLSAFYWTYALSQPAAGWLAERSTPRWVIAGGFAIWSIATMLTGAATGFATLLGLRMLLGVGESVAFPCSSKLLAQHVAISERGRANGGIAVGLALGPAFGTYVGGLILARFGWRPLFVSLGALSLLWLWPWLAGAHPADAEGRARAQDAGPSFVEIIRQRAAIGSAIGHFCFNYGLYFVLSWLPLYLVRERGFSIPRMAAFGGAIYLVQAVSAWVTGRAQDRWIRRGGTPNRAYKAAVIASGLIVAGGLLGAVAAPPLVSAGCLLLIGVAFGLSSATLYAAAQTLAGPTAAGRWVGFQNMVGNFAGIVGPAITGFMVDRSGHFFTAFGLAIAVALTGVWCWVVIVPRIEPLTWSQPRVRTLAPIGAET